MHAYNFVKISIVVEKELELLGKLIVIDSMAKIINFTVWILFQYIFCKFRGFSFKKWIKFV